MDFVDYVLIAVVAAIIVSAAAYIVKAKKSGQKCIGCPNSKTCSGGCGGNCQGCGGSCGDVDTENE